MTTLTTSALQESGHDGTEANNATSGSLDIGSSASGASGSRPTRAGGIRSSGARGTAASGTVRAGSSSVRAGGRSDELNGGAVVCADSDSAGGVDHGASAGTSKGKSVDTRADGGDVSGRWLSSDDSRLRSDNGGLGADVGGSGGHASHDTERVGHGEVAGLGSRVDGGERRRGRALVCMLAYRFREKMEGAKTRTWAEATAKVRAET